MDEDEYRALIGRQTPKETEAARSALDFARQTILRLHGTTCIHDRKPDDRRYCDDCPVSDLGGFTAEEKAKHPSREQSKALCTLGRYYSIRAGSEAA